MPEAVGYKIATSKKFITTKKRVNTVKLNSLVANEFNINLKKCNLFQLRFLIQMEEMLSDIKAAFTTMVNEAKWMDDVTRKKALIKVNAMGHMIGFPQEITKPGFIGKIYNEVIIFILKNKILLKNC